MKQILHRLTARTKTAALTGLLLCVAHASFANISINKNIIYIPQKSASSYKEVTVTNTHPSRTLNVFANTKKIMAYHGMDNEETEATSELSVFPPFFTLKAGQRKTVRLIAATGNIPDVVETAYRVQFLPTTQEEDVQPFEIITSMGALVFIPPTEQHGELTVTRTASAIQFKNDSNSTLTLRKSSGCAKGYACFIPPVRLWPGNSWKLNLPETLSNQDILLEKIRYGASEAVTVPAYD